MNRAACEKALGSHLEKPLESLGFRKAADLDFVRDTPTGGHTLRFGSRIDQEGRCQFSGTAGVIFREIEAILKHTGKAGSPLLPTIVMPLHLLRADRKYFEWPMHNLDQAPQVAADVVVDIEAYALPFFEQFGDVEAVQRVLALPRPPWFVLTPEQRLMTLAAMEHLAGSPDAAIKRLYDALAEQADVLPKRRQPLERLHAYLTSSG